MEIETIPLKHFHGETISTNILAGHDIILFSITKQQCWSNHLHLNGRDICKQMEKRMSKYERGGDEDEDEEEQKKKEKKSYRSMSILDADWSKIDDEDEDEEWMRSLTYSW